MKVSNLFLNEENSHKLYCYEILNLNNDNKIEIEDNAHNIFFIGNEIELKGLYGLPSFNITYSLIDNDENNKKNIINHNLSYEFFTNQNFNFFNHNKKYIFTKAKFDNEKYNDIYVATDNSSEQLGDLNEILENDENLKVDDIENEDYLLTLQLMPITQQQIFENTKYKFIFVDSNWKNEINNIAIEFENECLISNISLIGSLENIDHQIIENIELPLEHNDYYKCPLFVNPISGNEKINFYVSALNPNQNINFLEVVNQINDSSHFNISEFLNNNVFNFILDLIEKNKILMNGFNGWNNSEIENFKRKYNSNKPEDYSNYQIQEFLNQNEAKDDLWKAKFRWLLLSLSQYIKSNYCFKNGFTSEHKLFLNFYLSYDPIISTKFKIKSEFWQIKNQNNKKWIEPKHNNITNLLNFEIDGNVVSLAKTPTKMEPQILTNKPVDFNENSFNFNYLCNLIISKNKLSNLMNLFGEYEEQYFYDQKVIKDYEIDLKKTYSYITPGFNNHKRKDSDILNDTKNELKNNKSKYLYEILKKMNISDDYEIVGDIEILKYKLLQKNIRNDASGEYGEYSWNNYYDEWVLANLRITTKKLKANIVNLLPKNYIFNYFLWKYFLIQKNLSENIFLNFWLKKEFQDNNWNIKKIKKIEINHILGKKINLTIGNLTISNINLFSKENEFFTKTKIKF